MKRDRATALLEGLLNRATGEGWPIELVEAVHVFGSYSRGALEPGDVDVAIDIDKSDGRWTNHFLRSMSSGRDPYAAVRVALRGRTRGISFLFERHDGHEDVPMVQLWERGDSIEVALERLHAIQVDITAGRAPRDAMLDCFEGLDHWLPRYARAEMIALIDDDVISVDQVVLEDAEIDDFWLRDHVDSRWSATSPLRRAAHASLAHVRSIGADLRATHLHGRDVDKSDTPHFIGFQLRYLSAALYCFDSHRGVQWLEVVNPTHSAPLIALDIRPGDRRRLRQYVGGSGSFFR